MYLVSFGYRIYINVIIVDQESVIVHWPFFCLAREDHTRHHGVLLVTVPGTSR